MSAPVLHLLAGPNGAGKSTFAKHVLLPETMLDFVNADEIAATRWKGDESAHAYEASAAAAEIRSALLNARQSFVTETVFSHKSKVDLVQQGLNDGYIVQLYVLMVPVEVTVQRVNHRVLDGGHSVPVDKIRDRYARLWPLIAEARSIADRTTFYDNSRASSPFRQVATYDRGQLVGETAWPQWTPPALLEQP